RIALGLLALDAGNREARGFFQLRGRRAGRGFVRQVKLVKLLTLEVAEACGEGRALRSLEVDVDRPVLSGAEGLDLRLALADETQRHRLHAPGRAAARQLAPQH